MTHKNVVVSPVIVDEQWAIIDYKAAVKHSAGMNGDPDCVYGSVTGREINSGEHTFRAFIDAYIVPILDAGFAPRQILVAHDAGYEFRTSILPEYKAKRQAKKDDDGKTDPEAAEQYEKASKLIKPFLAYLGCTQAQVPGVEADDIIAYFCKLPGMKQIYTVDADLLSLADDQTMIMLKGKPVYIKNLDTDMLTKNMLPFVTPFMDDDGELPSWNIFKLLTLYKSLVGDTSDEYKGVSGFGNKMWADAVKEFERDGLEELAQIVETKNWATLTEYLEHYEGSEHKGCKAHKILTKINEYKNAWRTCWVVAKLHPELCWKPRKRKLTSINWFKRIPSKHKVQNLLAQACCLEYMEDLEPYLPVEWLIDADNFEDADIAEFAQMCEDTPHISYDYEGWAERNENFIEAASSGENYVDVIGQQITGMSINFGNNLQYTFYITVGHAKSANLPVEVIRRFFDAMPAHIPKVAHNSVFEEAVTLTNLDGYCLPIGSVHDTSIMDVYWDENRQLHNLKELSHSLLGYKQATYRETLDAAGASNMSEITAEQCLKYGLDDSTCTGHLYDLIKLNLMLEDTWEFYRDHEPYVNHRLAKSLVRGVDIDYEALQDIADQDAEDIEEGMAELRSILEEHCSNVNRDAAQTFFDAEKKFLEASARAKYGKMEREKFLTRADNVAEEIEKMDIADDTFMEINQRIRVKIPAARGKKAKDARDLSNVEVKPLIAWVVKFELHKVLQKLIAGSVYVKYESKLINPSFTPTALNLDKVASEIGLPPPNTAAKGKLDAWETEVRDIDFEADTDRFDELTSIQQEFIVLLREGKNHFSPDKRGHEDFLKLQEFCANVLKLEGKTVTTGTELNLGSPNQVKELLYCMLALPVRLRGVASNSRRELGFWDGSPATDSLARDTALAEDISDIEGMEWKANVINLIKKVVECQTRFSLYHKSYPLFKHPKTGKIHPGIRNCGTVTKRPAGSAPNILQVSKHQKKGVMRSIYVPPRGYVVVPIDFAGQELRIQASETEDLNLLSVYLGQELAEQYLSGEVVKITYDMVKDKTDLKDLHGLTASGITQHFGLDDAGKLIAGGTPAVKWSPETYEDYMAAFKDADHEYHDLAGKVRKRPAKSTNFLLSYGGTATTLSHRLIIKESVAQGIMDSTLTLYKGIPEAQNATIEFARSHGYVCTAYGTRRHANEDIFSKAKGPVNRQVRQLYNARIQGCAADILKVVMANCEKTQLWDRYDAVMVAPVYDELVAFVPYGHAWDFVQDLRAIMNLTPPGHAVPMVADVSIGPNWQIQHELGDQPTKEAFDKVLNEEVIPVVEATWDRIDEYKADKK